MSIGIACSACWSCDTSSKAKQEQYRQDLAIKKEQFEQLAVTYKAKTFPPDNLRDNSYTYEFQKFFANIDGGRIVFAGFLKDIEIIEGKVFAEFMCPIKDKYKINSRLMRFRLMVPDSIVATLINTNKDDHLAALGSSRYMIAEPDYYIVAIIERVDKIGLFRVYSSGSGVEAEIESDDSAEMIAKGKVESVLRCGK